MQLDDLIQKNYNRMNANDRRIWQYICEHREECRQTSLHQLADACEVSQTTILRFLRLIGMDGFNDFKAFLKWDSLNLSTCNQRSIEQNCFNLTRTITAIQQTDCSELFRRMDRAYRIYAYGSGGVQKAVARAFKNYMLLAERLLHVIEGAEERLMAMYQIKEGDVFFLLSVTGNDTAIIDYAKALLDKGVFLAAVCQDGANDLSKLCHFCLPLFTQKLTIGHSGNDYYSSAGMLPIVETLVLKYIVYRHSQDLPHLQ
ncbi:MAG: MurR/RpiR family transcriptional regulator [Oscillospiraceae bacterium]|nr:MurR/RpiR family transcriptional regulator [Oscillospiraceae bacterium]